MITLLTISIGVPDLEAKVAACRRRSWGRKGMPTRTTGFPDHQVLFDNLPLLGWALSKHFPQHCRITGIWNSWIDRILEEIVDSERALSKLGV